jgi:hypothetical protein
MYLAGCEFQKYEANKDEAARQWLAKVYRELGADGSAIAHDMIIKGLSAREVAAARDLRGQLWEKFYNMRVRECLGTMSIVFGFSTVSNLVR